MTDALTTTTGTQRHPPIGTGQNYYDTLARYLGPATTEVQPSAHDWRSKVNSTSDGTPTLRVWDVERGHYVCSHEPMYAEAVHWLANDATADTPACVQCGEEAQETKPQIWIDGQDTGERGEPVPIVGACGVAASDDRTWLREMRGERGERVQNVGGGGQAQETKPKIWIDGQDAKQQDPEGAACIICEENEPRAALIPCGHIPACIACMQRILSDATDAVAAALCPTCRTPVTGVLKVFPN